MSDEMINKVQFDQLIPTAAPEHIQSAEYIGIVVKEEPSNADPSTVYLKNTPEFFIGNQNLYMKLTWDGGDEKSANVNSNNGTAVIRSQPAVNGSGENWFICTFVGGPPPQGDQYMVVEVTANVDKDRKYLKWQFKKDSK